MADQASMRFNSPGAATGRMGTAPSAGPDSKANGHGNGQGNVVGGLAEFGDDLLSLAELQARLAAMELRQNVAAARFGGAIIAIAAALALAALPVALAGVAELLVSFAGMNRGVALLAVAAVALAIAGVGVAIAAARLRGSDLGFPLSREEFSRNLNWIRTVILYSGRSKPRR